MPLRHLAALLFAALVGLAGPAQAAADKVALVIGNGAYQHASQLPNPTNDARDLAAALEQIGFEVTLELDADFNRMRQALRDFSNRTEGVETAMVYFAGHGIEIDKQNYLIPVDAKLASDRDVSFEAISLDFVTEAVNGARKLKMVLLDACRNNPFIAQMSRSTTSTRSIGRGLTPPEPGGGTLIAYAAKGGTVAEDGNGRNSPFATALIEHIGEPGLDVQFLFRRVRDEVLVATNNRQEPFVYGSLPGENVFIVPPGDGGNSANNSGDRVPAPQADEDQRAWEAIKDTNSPAILEAFLADYPKSLYAKFAIARLAELRAPKPREELPVDNRPKPDDRPTQQTGNLVDFPPSGSGNVFVVLQTLRPDNRTTAESRVATFNRSGVPAIMVSTDDYDNMTPGYLAIVLGPYTRAVANRVLPTAQSYVPDAFIRVANLRTNDTRGDTSTNNCREMDGPYRVTNLPAHETLNIRAGRGTNFEVLAELVPETTGLYVGQCRNDWCQIQYGCLSGYAAQRYLSTVSIPRNDNVGSGYRVTGHKPGEELNVRSGPGTDFRITSTIPHNGSGIVVDYCEVVAGYDWRWCWVTYRGNSGYAYARYLADSNGNVPQ